MAKETLEVSSFIRGYHEYMDLWEPKIDDEYELKREPENKEDSNAVAVVRNKQRRVLRKRRVQPGRTAKKSLASPFCHPNEMNANFQVIGHAPKLMAIWLTKFLKRATNSSKVVVRGKRVNRGGGYGLEVPCVYSFTGDAFSIGWLKAKLTKEGFLAQ